MQDTSKQRQGRTRQDTPGHTRHDKTRQDMVGEGLKVMALPTLPEGTREGLLDGYKWTKVDGGVGWRKWRCRGMQKGWQITSGRN